MRIVIAIGGNSLIKTKKDNSIVDQYSQVETTASNLSSVITGNNQVVITHGNGPQVGFLLQMQETSSRLLPIMPIDYCVADTQGGIGYQIQTAFQNELIKNNSKRVIVSLVTRCEVSVDDPAFNHPTKPIGTFFKYDEIATKSSLYGWTFVEDSGRGYRRVVASPKPIKILEKDSILNLLEQGAIVVAAGGGGIPVIKKNSRYVGIEAVIDKDFASSLLARDIKADVLVISTGVPHVSLNFGQPDEKRINEATVAEMKKHLEQGHFGKGSMEPKITAGIQFTEETKCPTIITCPESIQEALDGSCGTRIIP
ncbi:MAG: carbamate kinase [Caldisericia bacterium]|nr:carbamate kinase [Caldisericia bacterium]